MGKDGGVWMDKQIYIWADKLESAPIGLQS